MKSTCLFLVIATLLIASIHAQGNKAVIAELQKTQLIYSKACIAKTGVDPKLIEDLLKGIVVDNQKLKEYGFCFTNKLGLYNDKMELQKEAMIKYLANYKGDAEARRIIEKCYVIRATPLDTVFYTNTCILSQLSPGSITLL